ncbi:MULTISPECIES: DUF262 domain-containing protein [Stenotrophomonas]|uniref:DUF262 domain-containing protein n=1 Tax=Stenotrophomonas TaxID=40323 RepID=UPI0018C8804D|nr:MULTISPECIES: DUF262 domain-containing protein [Stenotrophomonas maltophilia group]MDT3555265.1 DUF262 domain-containing protein [Stenotrophomonas maltophilia group sp. msm1]
MPFSPSEQTMWLDEPAVRTRKPTDEEINSKYSARELRIVTESNREQLPNFVAALKRPDWMRLQPFYQRRKRWDVKRKSKLIESFIMNVPVPPCFLFESDFARYEVMDGQQRISTIREFYENNFKLRGLEQWPELNGRQYNTLPSEIRKGLDRRSISYIVLLKESATTGEHEMLLRQQVFERLNTGGVHLENQEIRHCIYHNEFEELLLELSRHPSMRAAWGLPNFSQEEEDNPPDSLLNNPHFSKMRDVEFVLRFFSLRHRTQYRGGLQQFLDRYMVRSRKFSSADIDELRAIFSQTIELATEVYGAELFKPWVQKQGRIARQPQVAFADAVMVGLSENLDNREKLLHRSKQVVEATHQLVATARPGTFTGQGNTAKAIQERMGAFKDMLTAVLA